jgi:hypothetical protein
LAIVAVQEYPAPKFEIHQRKQAIRFVTPVGIMASDRFLDYRPIKEATPFYL